MTTAAVAYWKTCLAVFEMGTARVFATEALLFLVTGSGRPPGPVTSGRMTSSWLLDPKMLWKPRVIPKATRSTNGYATWA